MNNNNNNNGIVYKNNKVNFWYRNHADEYCGIEQSAFFTDNSIANTIEQIGYKQVYNEVNDKNKNHNRNNIINNNNNDLTLDSKDEFDEDQEEKKLFEWPQNNMPQLYSNETISLDIEDDKVIGILV
jgi:hypothetical protein